MAPPLCASDGLVIRAARSSDLVEVAELAAEREGEAFDKWLVAFERTHAEALSGRSLLVVASLAERIIAYGKVGYFASPTDSLPNVAPEGWYLTGVVVRSAYRRRGLGLQLTVARLAWIRERSRNAYFFANERNRASIELHRAAGFVELTRDFHFPGAQFEGGSGIMFVCDLHQSTVA